MAAPMKVGIDRGALHGRYLVLRQWRDGKSVQVEG